MENIIDLVSPATSRSSSSHFVKSSIAMVPSSSSSSSSSNAIDRKSSSQSKVIIKLPPQQNGLTNLKINNIRNLNVLRHILQRQNEFGIMRYNLDIKTIKKKPTFSIQPKYDKTLKSYMNNKITLKNFEPRIKENRKRSVDSNVDNKKRKSKSDNDSVSNKKKSGLKDFNHRHIDGTSQSFYIPKDIGGRNVTSARTEMNQTIECIVDSTDLYYKLDIEGLYNRFCKDGYLCLRGVLDRNKVLQARDNTESILKSMNYIDDKGNAINKTGWTLDTEHGSYIIGKEVNSKYATANEIKKNFENIATCEAVHDLFSADAVSVLLTMLSQAKELHDNVKITPMNFAPHYSWMRIKAPKEYTPEHSDIFYFRDYTDMFTDTADSKVCLTCKTKGDKNNKLAYCTECGICHHENCYSFITVDDEIYCSACSIRPKIGTCWIPLGDIDINDGVLAILPASGESPVFSKNALKNSQISANYFKHGHGPDFKWKTGSFRAGDFVIFDSKTVHCSTKNYSGKFRMSLDFRWYLAPSRTNFGCTPHSEFIKNNTKVFEASKVTIEQEMQKNISRP